MAAAALQLSLARKFKPNIGSPDSSPSGDNAGSLGKARALLTALGHALDEIAAELENGNRSPASPRLETENPRFESEVQSEVSVFDIGQGLNSHQLESYGVMSLSSLDSLTSTTRRNTMPMRGSLAPARKSSADRSMQKSEKRLKSVRGRMTRTSHTVGEEKDPLDVLAASLRKDKDKDSRAWRPITSGDKGVRERPFGITNSKSSAQKGSPTVRPEWLDESGIDIVCVQPEDKVPLSPRSPWQDCDGTVAPERARMENGLEQPSSWSVPEGLTPESWEHLKKQMEAQNVSVVDWLEGNGTIPEEDEDAEKSASMQGHAAKLCRSDQKNFDFDDLCIEPDTPDGFNSHNWNSMDEMALRRMSKVSAADIAAIEECAQSMQSYDTGPQSEDAESSFEMMLVHNNSVKYLSPAEMELIDRQALELAAEYGNPKHNTSRCMLSPASSVRVAWDLVWCCCLLFDLWITPFQVVYVSPEADLPPSLATMVNTVLTYYICDIILNFRTGYTHSEKDMIVMDQRLAAIRYLTGWFWFDFIVTMPWDEIFKSTGDGDMSSVHSTMRAAKASKAFRVLKVLKLLRVFRLFKTFKDLRFAKVKRAEKALIRKEAKRRQFRSRASAVTSMTDIIQHAAEPVRLVASGLMYLAKPIQLVSLLLFLAHFHACIWWGIFPDAVQSEDINVALRNYYNVLCSLVNMLTFGTPLSSSESTRAYTPGLWTFEIIVLTERMLLVMELTRGLLLEALIHRDEEAGMTVHKEGAMSYMMRHDISAATQLQVLQSVSNTGDLQTTQRHFKDLMTSSVPPSLCRAISEELWTAKLLSLGLIEEVNDWNENLVVQLTQVVVEEVYAPKVIVFREGDHAAHAYKLLSGEAIVVMASVKKVIPPFTGGSWIGEKVLVNPDLRRSATMVTKSVCTLMAVPGDAFYELICELELLDRFQAFCSEELWRGLCGRCGTLGDHFAQDCPLLIQKAGSTSIWKAFRKNLRRNANRLTVLQPAIAGDLKMFLEHKEIQHLGHDLFRLGIIDLKDLEDAALNEDSGFSATELKQLSLEAIQEFQRFKVGSGCNFLKQTAPESAKTDHFMFLSHYKVEAGSEAALMRMELEHILGQEASHSANHMDCPIFLDSDNLTTLDDLQERVRASWNLCVLLTPGVLKRPYCLVEIATALAANIQVILINVDKPGSKFEYPNEKFYEDFMAGKILSRPDVELLEQYNCTLAGVRDAIRQAFIRIALPYSPHRATGIRQAELKAILEQCATRPSASGTMASAPTAGGRRRPSQHHGQERGAGHSSEGRNSGTSDRSKR